MMMHIYVYFKPLQSGRAQFYNCGSEEDCAFFRLQLNNECKNRWYTDTHTHTLILHAVLTFFFII